MYVTVRFAGPMRTLAGRQQEIVPMRAGATLRDLLDRLAGTMPPSFVREVIHAQLAGSVLLPLVNASAPGGLPDLDRPLADGDTVAFVPAMSGG
jgi:molybdopterin converting factor small subunit